jgi:nucleotide-binding universal stress UspA family protein
MSQKGGMASISVIESAETDLQRFAEEYLASLADQINENGLSVNTAVRIGIPYIQILEYVDKNEIDLIVMATRGESGITRWLLGTVTDHVVRGSQVPVLVIPVDTG